MAKLFVEGSDGRHEYDLGDVTTIGRHPDNAVQILDRIVSKEHAQILRLENGGFLYRDLGSLNGSFYQGERISERILQEGDALTLGSTHLVFKRDPTGAAVLENVMIAPSANETLLRQQLRTRPGSREFLPEKDITDIEVLRRDYEKLRLAHELGHSIGLEVDLDVLLEKIITKAFDLIPADRGVILLLEEGVPRPRIARTRDGRTEQIVLSRSILSEVVQQKTAVLSADASLDSRFQGAHSIILQGIRSTMTVPLLHREELLGVMHLDSKVVSGAFGEKDLHLFAGIASQAAAAIHNTMLARKIEQEARTRAQFQRLLSPNLVEQVVAGKLELAKGGALQEVTALFADIRGFTAMAERRAPQDLVRMLNEYFEMMVDVIFQHEGTLDKFVGDEIIALFGAPVALPHAELQAVECALGMMRALKEWNRTRASEGQDEIHIGIGINTGPVVTGAIGSSRALQYTAIGDAMNLASRLCGAAKSDQILISGATHGKIADRVAAVAMPPMRFKNKAEEQKVFNLIGLRGAPPWRHETAEPV